MSLNLTLDDDVSGCRFDLYQTPTNDTMRILEGKTREDIFKLYIEWLKEYRKDGRKKLNKYDTEMLKEHEEKLRKFLAGHPNATWSFI
jgi:hypothetical protein